jgi:hypothetical protein
MSVHGEYERSLENLILRLRPLPSAAGKAWIDAFSALRMQHQPDLSTAARETLALLERLESELPRLAGDESKEAGAREGAAPGPRGNILRETASHLRAHCEAVLGVSGLSGS